MKTHFSSPENNKNMNEDTFQARMEDRGTFLGNNRKKRVYMLIKTTVRSKHLSKEGTQKQSTYTQNFLGQGQTWREKNCQESHTELVKGSDIQSSLKLKNNSCKMTFLDIQRPVQVKTEENAKSWICFTGEYDLNKRNHSILHRTRVMMKQPEMQLHEYKPEDPV